MVQLLIIWTDGSNYGGTDGSDYSGIGGWNYGGTDGSGYGKNMVMILEGLWSF